MYYILTPTLASYAPALWVPGIINECSGMSPIMWRSSCIQFGRKRMQFIFIVLKKSNLNSKVMTVVEFHSDADEIQLMFASKRTPSKNFQKICSFILPISPNICYVISINTSNLRWPHSHHGMPRKCYTSLVIAICMFLRLDPNQGPFLGPFLEVTL